MQQKQIVIKLKSIKTEAKQGEKNSGSSSARTSHSIYNWLVFDKSKTLR